MAQSTVALIIMLIAVILYVTEWIPVTITCLASMLAMIFTGILAPGDAFSGFANSSTLLVAGMMIIGEACVASGLSDKIGSLLFRFTKMKKKYFIFIVYMITGTLSIFMNGTAILAAFFPVFDAIEHVTDGRISRKSTYMPAGIATVIGGPISIIGMASILTGVTMLSEMSEFGRMMSFFEPAMVGLPMFLTGGIFYLTVGSRLQDKIFRIPSEESFLTGDKNADPISDAKSVTDQDSGVLHEPANPYPGYQTKKNIIITAAVFVSCVVLWIGGWVNSAAVAVTASCILIAIKCVKERTAYSRMSWETVIVLGASIGFAKGVDVSGASMAISDFIMDKFSFIGQSPFGMCVLIVIISSILSNLMSNTSVIVIMIPVAVSLATGFNSDIMPFAMAALMGTTTAIATPISTACITMTMPAGYHSRDYIKFNGILNIILIFVVIIAIKCLFFI